MANAGEGIFWGDAASDPKRKYRFFLYIGGIPVWTIKTVDKPTMEIAEQKHTFLNHEFKFPGRVTWKGEMNVTLADPVQPDLARTLLNAVMNSGYSFPDTPGAIQTTSKAKAIAAIGGAVRIVQLDADGGEVEVWDLKNAWFSSVDFGGNLSYEDDGLTELQCTIKYDWAEMSKGGQPVSGFELK
jgi:hypothetical protein